jgi:hypothetical protein
MVPLSPMVIEVLADIGQARMTLSFWFTGAYFLVTALTRNRRPSYGTVFDSYTLQPVPQATIALIRDADKTVVRSTIADEEGRIRLFAPEGEFRLLAVRSGYTFPSKKLGNRKNLGDRRNIYHGGLLTVFPTRSPFVAPDIPMDADEPAARTVGMWIDLLWHVLGTPIKAVLFALTAATGIVYRDVPMMALAGMELIVFVVFQIRWPSFRKTWGVIRHRVNRTPVPYARVEIIEPRFNKIIDVTITDLRGRYSFFVPNFKKYLIRVERPGFFPYISKQLLSVSFLTGQRYSLTGKDILLEPDPSSSPIQRGELKFAATLSNDALQELLEMRIQAAGGPPSMISPESEKPQEPKKGISP